MEEKFLGKETLLYTERIIGPRVEYSPSVHKALGLSPHTSERKYTVRKVQCFIF